MKRPAVFFDRDNTLIVNDGYLGNPAEVRLIEGAAVFLAKTNDPAATTADALCKHAIRIESTRAYAAACGCVDGDRATAAARIEPIAARNGSAGFAGIFLGRAGIAAHGHAIEAA